MLVRTSLGAGRKPARERLARFCCGLGIVLVALGATFARAAEPSATLHGEALLNALRQGGYSIYFRHAATDWSRQDQVRRRGDWESCDPARMRQLSDPGRKAAQAIGDAIRALAIPVGKVYASPYCRTIETASLMGLGEVVPTTDVMNMRMASYFGGRDAIIHTAQRLLSKPPEPGTNTVIVAHGNVARDATPIYPAEGEGVVFESDRRGGFRFIGRITADGWYALSP